MSLSSSPSESISSLLFCFSVCLLITHSVWRNSIVCNNQLKLPTVILFRMVWNPPTHAFNCSHAYTICFSISWVNDWNRTYLSIKCTFIMRVPMPIMFNHDKIPLTAIQGSRFAPCSTQIVWYMMIDIMIGIHNVAFHVFLLPLALAMWRTMQALSMQT
jgi:hypothetical protein